MAKHDKESTIMIPLFYEILAFVMYDILIQLKNLDIYLIHSVYIHMYKIYVKIF